MNHSEDLNHHEEKSSISDRYPRVHALAENKKNIRWLLILVIIGGLAIAYVGFMKFSNPSISGSTQGYQLIDSHHIQVRVQLDRHDDNLPASCVLRARNEAGAEVGRREVLFPAHSGKTPTIITQVETTEPGFVGEVYGCGYAVPSYLTRTP